jgi:cytochrome c-type biogenesis protein CcmH
VTTGFWMLAALAVLAALATLLWPMLRAPRSGGVAAQTALLREQLDALKSAHAAGLVDEASFKSRQDALSAAALKLIDDPSAARPALSGAAKVTAVLLLLALPIATMMLYERIGTPNAIGFSGPAPGTAQTESGPAATNAPALSQAAETLAAKLKDNPNDGEGWVLLARTYRATENFAEAAKAYERALSLVPESADLLAEAAESKGLSSEPRTLLGEPLKLIERALQLEPENQNALFLKGLALAQSDDPAGAETTWNKLLGLMNPGTPAHNAVVEQMNIVRARLGKGPIESAPAAPAVAETSPPPVPAATGDAAGIEVSVRLAPELAAQVSPDNVLFVFARAEQGPPAPLAIQRLVAGALPITLKLDENMGMVPGMSLAQFPRVVIGARISKSGDAAAQPGDLEGLSAALDWRAAGKVEVVIDRVR